MYKKHFFYIVLFSISTFVILLYSALRDNDGLLHVVFCDVGQGDSIYIRFPGGEDMLVDGGPNSDVLTCLGKHMAFWDRTIELVVLTHPQYDHYRGLLDVVSRYEVERIVVPPIENKAKSYQELKQIIREKEIVVNNLYAGDSMVKKNSGSTSAVAISILSPEADWVAQNIPTGSDKDKLLTKKVLGLTTSHSDLNDFSIVLNITYGSFNVLLTGDAEAGIMEKIITSQKIASKDIEIFKIGHHGARAGLSHSIAEYIDPDLAVISVGKNNRYGHPKQEVLDILSSLSIATKRTDQDGEIEVVSDGKEWYVSE